MKIKISYFYQIRFFKRYQIPVSTAASDPKWFHEFKHPGHYFKDKNGVYNGLRIEALHPNFEAKCCKGCKDNPAECSFIIGYRQQLDETSFDEVYTWLETLASNIQKAEKFEEEPEIILIVYETPENKCSERGPLIDWFRAHGAEITEFEAPKKNN